jgi:hypothetical protein
MAKSYLCNQALKAFSLNGGSSRLTKILINHDDPLSRPTQSNRSFA